MMKKTKRDLWFDKYPLGSHALDAGGASQSATRINPGFSFSEEMDLAWALGFPWLSFVCEGHPDDVDPVTSMRKYFYDETVVPERIAASMMRDRGEFYSFANTGTANWTDRSEAPLTDDEAKGFIRAFVFQPYVWPPFYILEALTSTGLVADAILGLLEELADAGKTDSLIRARTSVAFLPVLLGRLPEPEYAEAIARLTEIDRRELPPDRDDALLREAFDTAFDREGPENQLTRATIHGHSPEVILEDVRSGPLGSTGSVSGRDVFVAGEEVIEIMRKRHKSANAENKHTMVAHYGWVKSEQTVLLFADMFSSRNLKPSLETWFVQRVDYARPILVDTEKAGGALGKKASTVLKFLDKALGEDS